MESSRPVSGPRKRGAKVLRQIQPGERFEVMTNEQLSVVIAECERAITEGTAEIEDYEAFVLCQKELARRTWA